MPEHFQHAAACSSGKMSDALLLIKEFCSYSTFYLHCNLVIYVLKHRRHVLQRPVACRARVRCLAQCLRAVMVENVPARRYKQAVGRVVQVHQADRAVCLQRILYAGMPDDVIQCTQSARSQHQEDHGCEGEGAVSRSVSRSRCTVSARSAGGCRQQAAGSNPHTHTHTHTHTHAHIYI